MDTVTVIVDGQVSNVERSDIGTTSKDIQSYIKTAAKDAGISTFKVKVDGDFVTAIAEGYKPSKIEVVTHDVAA